MGKPKKKLGDSWLDPPKSEKPKKKPWEKKTILRDSWLDPLFLKTSPELVFLVFLVFLVSPRFFGFLILLILGGPSKSLSELFLCFLCFLKVFWFSIWTYFSPQGICSFCLRLKPSELNTSFVLVQISIYKSECINCWLVSMRLPLAFPNSLTCSCEDTLSFTWNGWKSLRA